MSDEKSDQKPKAKKIRRRRTTGRVGGTTQSAFASQSMADVLEQQAEAQARKKAAAEAEKADENSEQEKGRDG